MGMRLEEPRLEHRYGHDIVSDGIVTGSIQMPGTGQRIILLADRQTTGGYPKIVTVILADPGAIGRARIGDILRFDLVRAVFRTSLKITLAVFSIWCFTKQNY
jgi:5-oxoprolinase (ATP-hydrolysing) subunit C